LEISKVERLILANQFELLSMNKNDYISQKDCKNNATILLEGYEYLYDEIFSGMDEVVSPEKGRFVLDILSMYRVISSSYEKLLEEGTSLRQRDIAFKGFDGNDESEEYSFACFFIKDYDRFKDLVANEFMEFNSHGSSISTYKNELETYNEIRNLQEDNVNIRYLTENEIKLILCIE